MSIESNEQKADSEVPVDYSELFQPATSDWQFARRLELAQKYLYACASCIDPESYHIVDPGLILRQFEEAYLAIKRMVRVCSQDIRERIEQIENNHDLCQNVVRLSTVSTLEKPAPMTLIEQLVSQFSKTGIKGIGFEISLPSMPEVQRDSTDSLRHIKAAIIRMAGVVGASSREAQEWYRGFEDTVVVEGVYDPRRVPKKYVVALLEATRKRIEAAENLSPEMRTVLDKEIDEAIRELERQDPGWNKVISRVAQVVLVLGAVITGLANVDDAASNLNSAYGYAQQTFHYIGSQSLIARPVDLPGESEAPVVPLLSKPHAILDEQEEYFESSE